MEKVRCPGDIDGRGCASCRKKGFLCVYSPKKKPGPKSKTTHDDEAPEEGTVLLDFFGRRPRALEMGCAGNESFWRLFAYVMMIYDPHLLLGTRQPDDETQWRLSLKT